MKHLRTIVMAVIAVIAYSTILSSVTIEYMNGKKIVLSGSELEDRVDYQY